MRILLIDDLAQRGWKQILEIVLFENNPIDFAEDYNSAKYKLENNIYDLIVSCPRYGVSDKPEPTIKWLENG